MGKSVMIVMRNDLFNIPYTNALTSTQWDNQAMRVGLSTGVYNLPSIIEFQDDATLLADLVKSTLDPEGFEIPSDWKRLLQLIRYTDFLGVDAVCGGHSSRRTNSYQQCHSYSTRSSPAPIEISLCQPSCREACR